VSTEHRLHRVGDLADRGAGARRRDRQFQQVAVARLTTLGDLGQTPLQLQYKPRRHILPPAPVLRECHLCRVAGNTVRSHVACEFA